MRFQDISAKSFSTFDMENQNLYLSSRPNSTVNSRNLLRNPSRVVSIAASTKSDSSVKSSKGGLNNFFEHFMASYKGKKTAKKENKTAKQPCVSGPYIHQNFNGRI